MTSFVSHAVGAAMIVLAGCGSYNRPDHETHPTAFQLQDLFTEVEKSCAEEREWTGVSIRPEDVWALAMHESGFHNLSRHCCGGGPQNMRSAGYWSLTSPVVARECDRLRIEGCPQRRNFRRLEDWSSAVCYWTVRHPLTQAKIVVHLLARNEVAAIAEAPRVFEAALVSPGRVRNAATAEAWRKYDDPMYGALARFTGYHGKELQQYLEEQRKIVEEWWRGL